MLIHVKDRHPDDWEELARKQPYFAVLTSEGCPGVESSAVATPAYFETGEADVSSLLEAITNLLGREIPMTSVLDFGSGAGRLTLPLARRAGRVVACDIAPTMLLHARENAEHAGLANVTFIESKELAELPLGGFDFVCSLLVLQHIPPGAGHALIRTLLSLLAPGGVAALQVTLGRPGDGLRRLARVTRNQRTSGAGLKVGSLPPGPVNGYDRSVIQRDVVAAGAHLVGRFATHDVDATGVVLIIEQQRRLSGGSHD